MIVVNNPENQSLGDNNDTTITMVPASSLVIEEGPFTVS